MQIKVKEFLKKYAKKRVVVPIVIALVIGSIGYNNFKSNQVFGSDSELD